MAGRGAAIRAVDSRAGRRGEVPEALITSFLPG